jgi:hypothetical protein
LLGRLIHSFSNFIVTRTQSRESPVGVGTGLLVGRSVFDSRQGLGIFFVATVSRPALGPKQSPIQWILGSLFLGVKRPGREADHSPPSSAKVKNVWSYTSTLQYVFIALCLAMQRYNFTFYLLLYQVHRLCKVDICHDNFEWCI